MRLLSVFGTLAPLFLVALGDTANSPAAVILLGPSGSGKSETGNTLLGDGRFKVSGGLESETLTPQVENTNYDGRTWQIVDTPGYFDTTRTPEELEAALAQFVDLLESKVAALAFVVPYGRFGEAHLRGWRLLQGSFGAAALQNTLLVFTACGDRTEAEIETEVSALCARETQPTLCSVLTDLGGGELATTTGRIVAFGHLEETRRARDRTRLLRLAAELESKHGPYEHQNFIRSRTQRRLLASRIAALPSGQEKSVLELLLVQVEAGAHPEEELLRRLEQAEGIGGTKLVLVDFEDRTLGPFQQVGSGWNRPIPMPYLQMQGYASPGSDAQAAGMNKFFIHTGSDSGVKVHHGDRRVGQLQSAPFFLGRGEISWEGTGQGGYLALCPVDVQVAKARRLAVESDDNVSSTPTAMRATECRERQFRRRSTNLERDAIREDELVNLVGLPVFIRIVDDKQDGWGFVALDNLQYPTLDAVNVTDHAPAGHTAPSEHASEDSIQASDLKGP